MFVLLLHDPEGLHLSLQLLQLFLLLVGLVLQVDDVVDGWGGRGRERKAERGR